MIDVVFVVHNNRKLYVIAFDQLHGVVGLCSCFGRCDRLGIDIYADIQSCGESTFDVFLI